MINDLKTQGKWKIQSTIAINYVYSKDSIETRAMHSKSHNIEILIGNETNEMIEELFDSLLQKDQKALKESVNRSEFSFDSVDPFYYKLHRIT